MSVAGTANNQPTVTQADIARRMNVSITTVSKALRGEPGIGAQTARRVRDVARQMGYRPNVFAQGLKTARRTAVGVLITSDITNPWYAQLVSRLEAAFASHGYTIMLGVGREDVPTERRVLEAFHGGHVAGVVVGPVFRQTDLAPLWDLASRAPVVLFSCLDEMPVDYVGIDHLAGARTVVDYLVGLGHRRIGYLCCPEPAIRESGQTRREGYERALFAHDLPLVGRDIIESSATRRGGYEAMARLLRERRDDLPTAFFCHNDVAALGALRALQAAGLRVPDDVSLVGYDGIDEAELSTPALTTVGNIMDRLVPRLVDVLMSKIDADPGAPPAAVRERIVPELIERESAAPPRTRAA